MWTSIMGWGGAHVWWHSFTTVWSDDFQFLILIASFIVFCSSPWTNENQAKDSWSCMVWFTPKAMNHLYFIMWMFCAPILRQSDSEVDDRKWTGCAAAQLFQAPRNKNASVQPPWDDSGMGSWNKRHQSSSSIKLWGLSILSDINAQMTVA